MRPSEVPALCQAHSPNEVITFAIDPIFTQMDKDDIRAATKLWTRDTKNRVEWLEVPIETAALQFVWLDSRAQAPVHLDPKTMLTYVGLQDGPTIYIVGGVISETILMLPVAVHEIGHYLGLKHVPQSMDTESCMTPGVDPLCLITENGIPTRDIAQYCDKNGCACN